MARKALITPYNPDWPKMYEKEAGILTRFFGDEVLNIYHIGSTVIPHINAKPIIDILIEVRNIDRIDSFNKEILKYGYLPKGEFGIKGRRFFIKGDDNVRKHHIHIFQTGNPEIGRHLRFRDYLINHPKDAQAYSRLKAELSSRFPYNIDGYTEAKGDFIRDIEKRLHKEP